MVSASTMKLTLSSTILALGFLSTTRSDAVPWERLEKNNTLLLILDLQVGLFQLARDWSPQICHSNILAHSALGNLFNLPVIMSTSAEKGPNGPLPKEILDMHPNAPLIERDGEVSALDNADVRAAVRATNKTQIIVAGSRVVEEI